MRRHCALVVAALFALCVAGTLDFAGSDAGLFGAARAADRPVYGGDWAENAKWGLLREVEVDKACTQMEIDDLDINKKGAYFMVFIPNNTTSKDARYWGLINGDTDLVNYCTSYLEITGGMKKAGYSADKPYLGRADANTSSLQTFTLLRDGTDHARWKTWATSGTPDALVESSRGSYHREEVDNVTHLSIRSDVKNALGKGSKLLIYGKYKSTKPEPAMKEFTLTEDRTEFTIKGLNGSKDGAYCMFMAPNNKTDREVRYSVYANRDREDENYVSVWHGVDNNHGPKEGGAVFAEGVTIGPLCARAEPKSSLTQHTWIALDARNHMRFWCETATGKWSNARAYGGYHKKELENIDTLTLRADVKDGLAAGSRVVLYGAGARPEPADADSVKSRTLEYRWFKEITLQDDTTDLEIEGFDLKASGFLNMDLIPDNLTKGRKGHYWSYVNGDMDNMHYCDAHFDVQKGILCAIGGHLHPYYGWAYPQTSSHQPALFMQDARGHVRSRGYGTCHVQGDMQAGKQSICGRAFHHTRPVDTMRNLVVTADVKNGLGEGTRILLYGGHPVPEE